MKDSIKSLQRKLFVFILLLVPFNAYPISGWFTNLSTKMSTKLFRGYSQKQVTKPYEPGFSARNPWLSKFGIASAFTGAAGLVGYGIGNYVKSSYAKDTINPLYAAGCGAAVGAGVGLAYSYFKKADLLDELTLRPEEVRNLAKIEHEEYKRNYKEVVWPKLPTDMIQALTDDYELVRKHEEIHPLFLLSDTQWHKLKKILPKLSNNPDFVIQQEYIISIKPEFKDHCDLLNNEESLIFYGLITEKNIDSVKWLLEKLGYIYDNKFGETTPERKKNFIETCHRFTLEIGQLNRFFKRVFPSRTVRFEIKCKGDEESSTDAVTSEEDEDEESSSTDEISTDDEGEESSIEGAISQDEARRLFEEEVEKIKAELDALSESEFETLVKEFIEEYKKIEDNPEDKKSFVEMPKTKAFIEMLSRVTSGTEPYFRLTDIWLAYYQNIAVRLEQVGNRAGSSIAAS